MRSKYIEIIKEYIKEKPEYKSTLEEIKASVLTIGATEEEFDEAVKQITGLPETSKLILKEKEKQPDRESPKPNKSFSFRLEPKRLHIVTFVALSIIVVAITLSRFKAGISRNKVISQNSSLSKSISVITNKAFPLVYANQQIVDPDKIFAIKPANTIQLTITGKPKKEILGFFPYWMLPKQDKIDLDALTSVSFFGLETDGNGNIKQNSDEWSAWQNPELDVFIRRAQNQGVKVYLTIESFNSQDIESLVLSDSAQKNFIANVLYLVNSKNLDGVNIDFEYLGIPSGDVRDGFTRLITNLNSELKKQYSDSTITIDTYLVSGSEKGLFEIPLLADNSDAFVIMGYDMHTPYGQPGPISAMGGDTNIIGYVQNYLEQVKPSKLILAVPYYGYDWLADTSTPSADTVKILPYAEIAQETENTTISWDDTSQTPYFTYVDDNNENRIVHFDDVRSLGIKYDFINRKDLRGVGIWALGYDGENQDLEKLLIDKFINQ